MEPRLDRPPRRPAGKGHARLRARRVKADGGEQSLLAAERLKKGARDHVGVCIDDHRPIPLCRRARRSSPVVARQDRECCLAALLARSSLDATPAKSGDSAGGARVMAYPLLHFRGGDTGSPPAVLHSSPASPIILPPATP